VLSWAIVGGLGNGVYGMSFLTTLQERTPAKHQTCINALYELVGSVAPGAGFLIGGIVAAAYFAQGGLQRCRAGRRGGHGLHGRAATHSRLVDGAGRYRL
jgi:hypothetical protein